MLISQRKYGEYTDSGGGDTMVHDSGDDDADTTTVMVRLLLTSLGIRGFDYAGGDTQIQGLWQSSLCPAAMEIR